jgi:ribosomal protein S27AE
MEVTTHREAIPDDDTLGEMGLNALRELASGTPVDARSGKKKLRKDLARWRDGGVVLECSNCGNKWVYTGNHEYRAPCSRCGSSVNLRGESKGE